MSAESEAPIRPVGSARSAEAACSIVEPPRSRPRRGPAAQRRLFWAALGAVLPAAAIAGPVLAPSAFGTRAPEDLGAPVPAALASITREEVESDLRYLASPELEGRDTPSRGLDLALKHVAESFAAAGLVPAPDSDAVWRRVAGDTPPPDWAVHHASGGAESTPGAAATSGTRAIWLRPYLREKLLYDRLVLHTPLPEECALELTLGDAEPSALRYGVDFVPLSEYTGEASGELVFAGFGIESAEERYDDFRGIDVRGKIVALVAGEPDHKRLFGGVEVTAEAAVWNKLDEVARRGAAGALVIRRPPVLEKGQVAPELAYRWTRATWIAPTNDQVRAKLPAAELHWQAAAALLGFDPLEWAEKTDRSGKSTKRAIDGRRSVRLRTATRTGPVVLTNVVGYLPGRDGSLAAESVVVGAHVDHIGVGPRERVGRGADDNASGTAALMEVAEALALARPARGVWCVGFSAEEDGLLGSAAFVADLPMPREQLVAMVNLDMIGRGDPKHVVALGFRQNPGMRDVVARAERLGSTGIKRVEDCNDEGLFQRSDHHSFHAVGIPTVFFFENYPLESNRDYHTWRDVADLVDFDKVRNTARLAFHTAWVLAEERTRLARSR
jgi:hypothetical protein